VHAAALQSADISELARQRFLKEERRPLMLSDWTNAAFIHFEADPQTLQQQIPYELDLFEGKAYVSIVAFSIRRLRLAFGGRIGEWLFRPIGNHEFFNVRTYVRHGDRAGIFFMAEWLNNPLSVALGPRSYGLPYKFGALNYDHTLERKIHGHATTSAGDFVYEAVARDEHLETCQPETLDEFLLERYTAFTWHRNVGRYFQIWHEPWPKLRLDVSVENSALLKTTGSWFDNAKLAGGNFSPGAYGIWMSAPHGI
jgi:uncharacterized protein YqjF (DUF2071 family)